MVIPSVEETLDDPDVQRIVPEAQKLDEHQGKLKPQSDEEKLMHSVLEDDKEKISDGKLLAESVSQGLGSLTPEMMLHNMIKDYKLAKKLYGETIIRELTGYSPNYIEKNVKIPEFQRELQKKVFDKIEEMKQNGLLNNEGEVTDKGLTLGALVMYVEELDHLVAKGFGEKQSKQRRDYGENDHYEKFTHHAYRRISVQQTIKTALRRNHKTIIQDDLRANTIRSEGKISIIYGIDASGSMKGKKLQMAKKAGIALAFKAIQEKNKVGIVVFGSEIKTYIPPTLDFMLLLRSLTEIRASMETDIAKSVTKAIELFPKKDTKHFILLTDALPTKGVIPERETLDAIAQAHNNQITTSLLGINLDEKGLDLAKKIAETGKGKLYKIDDLDNMDMIILQDYEDIKKG